MGKIQRFFEWQLERSEKQDARFQPCPDCGGYGKVEAFYVDGTSGGWVGCERCFGKGRVRRRT